MPSHQALKDVSRPQVTHLGPLGGTTKDRGFRRSKARRKFCSKSTIMDWAMERWMDGWMDGWMFVGFGSCKKMMKDYESYFLIDDLFGIDLLRSLFKHQIKCIFARLRPFEKTSDRERSEVCNNWKRGHLDNQLSDNSQVPGFQNNHALRNWLAYACPLPVPSHILLKQYNISPTKISYMLNSLSVEFPMVVPGGQQLQIVRDFNKSQKKLYFPTPPKKIPNLERMDVLILSNFTLQDGDAFILGFVLQLTQAFQDLHLLTKFGWMGWLDGGMRWMPAGCMPFHRFAASVGSIPNVTLSFDFFTFHLHLGNSSS